MQLKVEHIQGLSIIVKPKLTGSTFNYSSILLENLPEYKFCISVQISIKFPFEVIQLITGSLCTISVFTW